MIIENRTLPIGIEHDGKIHKELEIRPRLVADMIDALESERAQRNDRYYGLAMLACQVVTLGDIPKEEITADLLLGMYEKDFDVLTEAAETARRRVEGFCPAPTGDGAQKPGGAAEGSAKDGAGASEAAV